MENMNKQHKEAVDIYEKDIEAKKVTENKLLEEVRAVNFTATLIFVICCFYGAISTRVLALT